MTSAFERHGIGHLSASSLNLWAAEPALWVMERLLRRRAPPGIPAARGKAVEAGVHAGLIDPALPVESCITEAEAVFDREVLFVADPRREDERKKIAGWVRGALAELRQYGRPDPDGYQAKIEVRLDDVPVPVIGFVDFRFSNHGLIVDLKTTERFPSAIGTSHGRQGAVYARAHGNYGMRFAYAKPAAGKSDPRQVHVLELSADEVREHLAALRLIALSLGRFLAVSNDARELAGLLVPDFDSFYWADPTARAAGREVFRVLTTINQQRRTIMTLNIGGSASNKSYAKYNAKADKWFVRAPDGGDLEISRPTFLLDLANIRTGWLRFMEGQAPERVIDPALDRTAPSPGEGFKRGFVVTAYSPKFFGGAVEMASASIHVANAIRDVYAAFEEQAERVGNRGKVPLVSCTGSEAMKDRRGANYKPKLELVRWIDRPADLPNVSPVEESEVWQGPAPAPKPASTHVPPPAPKPPPAPAFETDF